MAKETLDLIINGHDRSGPALLTVIKRVATLVLSIAAIRKAGEAMTDLAQRSAQMSTATAVFENLAHSIGEQALPMLEQLRASTGGMATDLELMSGANRLVAMRLATTSEEASRLAGIAVKLGAAFGTDATTAMENFALMLVNTSYLRLDTYGLSADRARARVQELTAANKGMSESAAFTQAVMEQADEAMARTGNVTETLTGGLARLRVSWTNLGDQIAASAAPLVTQVANTLADIVSRFGPTIQTLAGGFFATVSEIGSVAVGIVRSLATAMGLDMDRLATDAQTWGENVVIWFANGMAAATTYVVQVLTNLGNAIAEWLQPGSPPKILPHLDDWGREAIEAYLGGMGEASYEDAQRALTGIQHFFDEQLAPIEARLTAIGRERADIQADQGIAAIEARLARGNFANPDDERLLRLRLEELQLQKEQRALEAEAEATMTPARDRLEELAYENSLLGASAGQIGAVSGAAAKLGTTLGGISSTVEAAKASFSGLGDAILKPFNISDKLKGAIEAAFTPVHNALNGLSNAWASVFSAGGVDSAGYTDPGTGSTFGASVGEKRGLGEIFDVFAVMLKAKWDQFAVEINERGVTWAVTFINEVANALQTQVGESFLFNKANPIQTLYDYVIGKENELTTGVLQGMVDLQTDLDAIWTDVANAIVNPFLRAYNRIVGIVNALIKAYNALPFTDDLPLIKLESYSPFAKSSKFATGGDFVTNGPQWMLVGDNPGGREHVQVTPIGSPNLHGPQPEQRNVTINVNMPQGVAARAIHTNLDLLGVMA